MVSRSKGKNKFKSSRPSSYRVFDTSLHALVRPRNNVKTIQAAYNMALYLHKQGSINASADATEAIGFSTSFIYRTMKKVDDCEASLLSNAFIIDQW